MNILIFFDSFVFIRFSLGLCWSVCCFCCYSGCSSSFRTDTFQLLYYYFVLLFYLLIRFTFCMRFQLIAFYWSIGKNKIISFLCLGSSCVIRRIIFLLPIERFQTNLISKETHDSFVFLISSWFKMYVCLLFTVFSFISLALLVVVSLVIHSVVNCPSTPSSVLSV